MAFKVERITFRALASSLESEWVGDTLTWGAGNPAHVCTLLLPKVARPVGWSGALRRDPALCAPVNNGSLFPCWPWFPLLNFLAMELFPSAASGCLLTTNSCSLPWFTTQLSSSLAVSQFRLGAQGCVTDSVHRSYSVLPSTVWLLHSTLTRNPKDSSLSPLIPLSWVGFSGCVTSPFLQNPLRGTDLSFFQFSPHFPSFLFATQLCSDFSYSLRCPRLFICFHYMLCENCSEIFFSF